MSSQAFDGKTALITGGSRGIGRATALRLAGEGARVAIGFARDDTAALDVLNEVEAHGGQGCVVQGDVAVAEEAQAMAAETREAFGPIDFLVHSAGVCVDEPVDEISWETWQRTFEVNVHGTFHILFAVKDEMIERRFGRIVNLASVAGLRPRPIMAHYAASKAAVISLTKSFSEAWAPHNIRINAIAPGLIDTDMARDLPEASWAHCIASTPMGRVGQPEEIANLARFLVSEESSFMTGQTLVASGGRVLLP